MKIKIRAEKNDNGKYVMVGILPDGEKEYPQEGLEHSKKRDVFSDAYSMYHGNTWNYDEKRHTIIA